MHLFSAIISIRTRTTNKSVKQKWTKSSTNCGGSRGEMGD